MRTFTSRLLPLAVLLLGGSLVAGCTSAAEPAWSFGAPPTGGVAASPSAPATSPTVPATSPSAAPIGSRASVLPTLTPKANLKPAPASEVNVAYAPNVPPASGRTEQAIVNVHFDVVEGVQTIDVTRGLKYVTWGYRINGDKAVSGTPGPIIRARVGDVLRFTITNLAGNSMPHNVDFHAVTGQGGGAADTTVAPGETAVIEARVLYPGMFMYHCAFGDVPLHISQGMYGGILIDPEVPLPPVAHELYMVQSEYYTTDPQAGPLTTDRAAVTNETPKFVVFNGAVGSLTGANAPHMQVGETTRIYFVNAGLNLDSNFHPIGSQWDAVYPEAALLNPPIRGSQTTLVPAGGGTVTELVGYVPMTVVLVDHALARAFDKGAIGQIVIDGTPDPEIFEAFGLQGSPAPSGEPASPPPSVEPASPPPSATTAPSGSATDVQVSMVKGSSTFQAANAPDEFAETENPPDYSINVLTIKVGTTVTWTNDDVDNMVHTVTAVDGSFDSAFLSPGQTFSHTFQTAGEFEYFCTPHPWMRAKVIVQG